MNMISKAWNDVKKETIEHCFEHAGWKNLKEPRKELSIMKESEMSEYTDLFERVKSQDKSFENETLEDFYTNDDNSTTRESLSDTEIVNFVEEIIRNEEKDDNSRPSKEKLENHKEKVISTTEAFHQWKFLKPYFEENIESPKTFSAYEEIDSFMDKIATKRLIQTTITTFPCLQPCTEKRKRTDSEEDYTLVKGDKKIKTL
ncbi:uncharacterized protein MONOS_6903 [Monocercomonoides exilis]|uniref:uncharacterized protein n=1 Tax=Monocercomonoides exilis TaxID=2049356 RepID=UPI003559BA50|nr:hypothetical protein MONOS_6903 [Monocercomonoides exilis]|eukprot:MONOS_6903.1-p1 / transcript=MONOS_6903.1 / gene=MONOS_6903 / organism=Monocercomonoides_exilis_PA203 / gene_product=unspecified product / transcript_product=unspecified product / location=Mono_scaffold00226:37785-38390(-) / protein_length=202 / sequence_SO=supercontig / SO=protein_coding / is_pseudo=false